MDRAEFEAFSEKITNKPFLLEPYRDFIVQRLSQFQDTPAAQMHDWLCELPLFVAFPKSVAFYQPQFSESLRLMSR